MNVALIGCGVMGKIHAEMARACGFRIAACGDAVRPHARSLSKGYDAEHTVDCLALTQRPDIDVVAIATPTPSHGDYALAAAKAGKHVFCEKPFTRTVPEAKRVVAAAERSGSKVFVGHAVRYFHEFEALAAQVRSGRIGQVGFVKTFRGGACPVGEKAWFHDFEQSGGAVLDVCIHDFDWVASVFGPVETVFCRNLLRSHPEPMDYAQTTLTLASGVIAQVVGSWAHPAGFRVKAELCGSGGMVQFDSAPAPLSVQRRQSVEVGGGLTVPASPVLESPYQREWRDFAAWLREDRPPRVTTADAIHALEIATAALKSAATGKRVTLRGAA